MFGKIILPLLALLGVGFAIYTVKAGSAVETPAQPVAQPARGPFDAYIAGAGIVEASTENRAVGTLVPGVVQEQFAKVGDTVRAGQPLFRIDDRELAAQVAVLKSAAAAQESRLAQLKAEPRPEDIPPAEAAVEQAQAVLKDKQEDLDQYAGIRSSGAISQVELRTRRSAVAVAKAQLDAAQADLAKLKAGAWKPAIDVQRAQVDAAESQVKQAEVNLSRLTVSAPVDGMVLQVNVRKGEYAGVGPLAVPLMLVGNVKMLHVRVDVDENDAWKLKPGAPAKAFLRGNADLSVPLNFVRVEPYVVPKRSLTGDSAERVDTRVLQVIYSFDAKSLPVYVGQQMDVFIEVPAEKPTTAPAK